MTITIPCSLVSGFLGLGIFCAGMLIGICLAGWVIETED